MIYEASRILRLHAIRANVKGGLISESFFSNWRKSQKKVPNHFPKHYPHNKKDA